MTSENFCYWLQGWFELNKTIDHRDGASKETLEMIQAHLNMVFIHDIDPKMGNQEHQNKLNEAHSGIYNNIFPSNEAQAIEIFGPKPSPDHEYNIHGWYDPVKGQPRC